jgi:segregation and condensation protein B
MNTTDAKRILEAALICAPQPLPLRDLRALLGDGVGLDTVRQMLEDIGTDWTQRGVALVQVASGWRFQSRPDVQPWLERLHPEKAPRYSRAALETLAVIAYRQPVTRGDMEEIRGVAISSAIIGQFEDRGWIEVIGHRDTVGRPALFATTRRFLDDLGLAALEDLPPPEAPDARDLLAQALPTLQAAGYSSDNAADVSPDASPSVIFPLPYDVADPARSPP